MRLAAITLAVATVLIAGGCNRISGGGDAGKAASLDFDKPVSGEITSRSGINFNDGSHHQLYQIKLEDRELVGLKLTGALTGSIAVFNNGSLVSTSNTGYEREGDVSLAFRANGGGTYQVAVNANGPSAFGPYRLRAEKLKPYDGKPLVGSGEIVDMLASNSQDYTLQVEKAGLYEIRLVSDVFDPVLKLSGQGVDAENDDGGDSTNSRLNLSLKPGKYTLTARGLGDGVNGMFTLSATRIELPGNLVDRDGTALPKSGSAYTMLDNEGRRRFLLTLDRPADVRLDAISSQVDTVLRVVGGDVELTDDDGGNGTNARLEETLPAGHYTVDVSSLNNGAGLVEVRVQVEGASADGAAASAARAAADAAAAVADDAAAAVEAASR
ncbi:ABC transporter substrate-binding protein [Stenotrophomonas sp. SM006]|uniref:ABC transporter substrate-binding protein n=1 Tax=Stenotrophomonas maltophilia TaxID=40324 RepID=UPI0013125C76|nr:ABC transporter substrate-binding protein [Stenotrophomonas maltophilia]QDY50542.1 ABC transporter substrate-binding protein [Stenotrophomonas maltophilia]